MNAMSISMVSALALGLLAVCVSAGGYGRGAYGYGGMQAMYPSYGYAHMVQPYVAGGGLSTAGFSVGFSEIFYYSKIDIYSTIWLGICFKLSTKQILM